LRAAALLAEGLGRAAAADHEGARRHFEDAIDLYGPSGGRYERACARIELGTALLALGQDERARTELAAAQRCFAELGAKWRCLQVAKLLETKADEVPTSGSDPIAYGLTPREIEVLKLVAAGLSNRSIGAKLFVSELTIKRHVANLLLKLELPSRAAAAAYAAKAGLV
jgi:DNA-binding NarL/FixJ family response regulator